MSNQFENPASMAPLTNWAALIAAPIVNRFRSAEPTVIIWWIFAASVAASTSGRAFTEMSGPLLFMMTVAGTAGCAWMWLFSRALFRPAQQIGPVSILVVGAVMVVESSWALTSGRLADGLAGELFRIAENAASLICIAAIVFVFVEALSGVGATMARRERRFRYVFAGVYGTIVAVALIGVSGAGGDTFAAQWKGAVLLACGVIAVIGSRVAISFRRRNPLTVGAPQHRRGRTAPCDVTTSALVQRVQRAVANENLLATPGLKVSGFADAIGEQEYKITQCVTGPLGYRNFNQFINAHRIVYARRMLSDAKNDARSISSIAYACGFNSIGPFNRAFKDHVGVTPSDFRAARKTSAA